jgi:hypothetical protein
MPVAVRAVVRRPPVVAVVHHRAAPGIFQLRVLDVVEHFLDVVLDLGDGAGGYPGDLHLGHHVVFGIPLPEEGGVPGVGGGEKDDIALPGHRGLVHEGGHPVGIRLVRVLPVILTGVASQEHRIRGRIPARNLSQEAGSPGVCPLRELIVLPHVAEDACLGSGVGQNWADRKDGG